MVVQTALPLAPRSAQQWVDRLAHLMVVQKDPQMAERLAHLTAVETVQKWVDHSVVPLALHWALRWAV